MAAFFRFVQVKRYLSGEAQNIGSRQYQQDCYGFSDANDVKFLEHGGLLAVLCDGMGGMERGDLASQTAVRAVLDAYSLKRPGETIPDALVRSMHEANRRVLAISQELGRTEGVGTTLVAAVVHDSGMHFLSVGDSGLFLASGGQLQMLNRPHVFANVLDQAVTRGTMSREQAENHPERESLTSFIGIQALHEIDRNTEPCLLHQGDTILLASDGMFKTLRMDEILASLAGHPQSWPSLLVARTLAKRAPSQDNVTVISVTLADNSMPAWIPFAEGSALARASALASDSRKPGWTRQRWLWIWAALVFVVDAALIAWIYFSR
jgi:serine/threonine protein phosphatase PrpC